MVGERRSMPVALSADGPLPHQVLAGDAADLTVRVSCPDRRERTGLSIVVVAPDGTTASFALAAAPDGDGSIAAIALAPPPQLGEHLFRATLPAHEIDGTHYDAATLDLPVRVMPQPTSLAVWEVPTSVVMGARFTVKAGVKSAASASLAGCAIEILDGAGGSVGRGRLGDLALPGTGALYWCDIEIEAPRREGLTDFTVRFAAEGIALPHQGSATSFRVAVVRAPEHVLSIKVIERESCAPIADAELRLGAYRGTTGHSGLAQIALPKGSYELHIWKVGFEAPSRTIEIDGDACIEIAAATVPEEDPDARWRM